MLRNTSRAVFNIPPALSLERAVMAGPAGFEPATSGLEGRRPILLGYGPSLLSFRGALIKVAVGKRGKRVSASS